MTEEGRIAGSPIFGAVLPEFFGWPERCCLCNKPAARRESISIRLPSAASSGKNLAVTAVTGGLLMQTGGGTRYTVEVPHCGDHKEGAALGACSGNGIKICFRSYPYLRSFCELNKISPG